MGDVGQQLRPQPVQLFQLLDLTGLFHGLLVFSDIKLRGENTLFAADIDGLRGE